MKAVIVEVEGKNVIALSCRGDFVRIEKRGNYEIGSEIDIEQNKRFNLRAYSKIASIAAAILLVTGLGIGGKLYYTPYSYICVDINPSIELTANIFDKIIGVDALNTDAEKLTLNMDIKNMNINSGVEEIVKVALDEGYLKTEVNNSILLTVTSKDEEETKVIEKEVELKTSEKLKSESVKADVITQKLSEAERNDSRTEGISPGKQQLIKNAISLNSELKKEELKNAPVKEIVKSIDLSKENDQKPFNSINDKKKEDLKKIEDSKKVQPSIKPQNKVEKELEKKIELAKQQEKQKQIDKQKELEKQKEVDRQKELYKHRELEKQKELEKQREIEKKKELEKQREIDKQKELEKQRALEKKKVLEKQREIEKQKELEKQREIEKQKELEKQKGLEKQKESDRKRSHK